jgi:ABC-type xylose transport system permease subunit
MKNIIDRFKSPTPSFFKKLRSLGIAMVAAGGAILAAPVTLPAIILTLGGYLVTAGSIMTAVAQATTEADDMPAGLKMEK